MLSSSDIEYNNVTLVFFFNIYYNIMFTVKLNYHSMYQFLKNLSCEFTPHQAKFILNFQFSLNRP